MVRLLLILVAAVVAFVLVAVVIHLLIFGFVLIAVAALAFCAFRAGRRLTRASRR